MTVEFRDLTPPAELRRVLDDLDLGGGTATVPLADARGRVLAERVTAGVDVPGFDRAAMDGYAVRAADTVGATEANPVRLSLVGRIDAGEAPDVSVGTGEAVGIATGAVLPDGADATVMRERTDCDDGVVTVRTAVAPGEHVMAAGADVPAGRRALGPGTELSARELGLLAAIGRTEVPVRVRPRVAVVSTGGELVQPGETLDHRAGQLFDVNATALGAAVEAAGGTVVERTHVGDDLDALERTLRSAASTCDLVLSSGSTSAGHLDVVHRVVADVGDLLVHGVAVKPGKPTLVGHLEEAAYVGLPGYPVSALTVFRTFVAPALRAAAGRPPSHSATVAATMTRRERFEEGRHRLVPVGLVEDGAGDLLAYPVDKGSGATTSLVEADGVVEVPAQTAYLAAEEPVSVTLFDPEGRPPSLLGVGDEDPVLDRLLDRLERPRYLPVGRREGLRRLSLGVPDVCVTAGPVDPPDGGVHIGGWTREWGLLRTADGPRIDTVADLEGVEGRLAATPPGTGLRASLAAALSGRVQPPATEQLPGLGAEVRTVHTATSGAAAVLEGRVDLALGHHAAADGTGLVFDPLGTQDVTVWAARPEKPAVKRLATLLDGDLATHLAAVEGFEPRQSVREGTR